MLPTRIAAVALCCAAIAFGQDGKDPACDAVSVKALGPNIQYGPGPGMTLGLRHTPTRISGNSQIPALIEEAYSLKPLELVLLEIPDLGLNVYELEAVMPTGTTAEETKGVAQHAGGAIWIAIPPGDERNSCLSVDRGQRQAQAPSG